MVQNVISLSAMVLLLGNDQYTDKIAVLLAWPRKTPNSDTRSVSMTSIHELWILQWPILRGAQTRVFIASQQLRAFYSITVLFDAAAKVRVAQPHAW